MKLIMLIKWLSMVPSNLFSTWCLFSSLKLDSRMTFDKKWGNLNRSIFSWSRGVTSYIGSCSRGRACSLSSLINWYPLCLFGLIIFILINDWAIKKKLSLNFIMWPSSLTSKSNSKFWPMNDINIPKCI